MHNLRQFPYPGKFLIIYLEKMCVYRKNLETFKPFKVSNVFFE